jgi:hypothetical protein
MSQVRISRTDDVDAVLSYLRGQYPLLSEADIIKMALSEKYQQAVRETMDDDIRRRDQERLEQLLLEGVRSERGMEVGSREWADYRETLRSKTEGDNKHKRA